MPEHISPSCCSRFNVPPLGVFVTIALCSGLAGWPTLGEARPRGREADDVPLIAAVKTEDPAAVAAVLGQGADVDSAQPDGATALHWAAFRDNLEIADLLIDAGADVRAVNELGATALWLAADNGSAPMVERLLASGARSYLPVAPGIGEKGKGKEKGPPRDPNATHPPNKCHQASANQPLKNHQATTNQPLNNN